MGWFAGLGTWTMAFMNTFVWWRRNSELGTLSDVRHTVCCTIQDPTHADMSPWWEVYSRGAIPQYVRACVCVHACVHACVIGCMSVCGHIFVCVLACARLCVVVYACERACVRSCVRVRMRVCVCTHTSYPSGDVQLCKHWGPLALRSAMHSLRLVCMTVGHHAEQDATHGWSLPHRASSRGR